MNKYYLKGLNLYRGCEYGVCSDFDLANLVYLKISCKYGLELIKTTGAVGFDNSYIIGVDIV